MNYCLKVFLITLVVYLISIIPCYYVVLNFGVWYSVLRGVRNLLLIIILTNKKFNNFNDNFKLNAIITVVMMVFYVYLAMSHVVYSPYSYFRSLMAKDALMYQVAVEVMFLGYFYITDLIILLIAMIVPNIHVFKDVVENVNKAS